MKLRDSENIFVLGGFLGITALVSGLVLALAAQITQKPIEEMQFKTMQKSLQMLNLPPFDNAPASEGKTFRSPGGLPVTLMPVRKAGKLEAFAVRCASSNGYAGTVEITAGLSLQGKILAVLVTNQKETPGLGSNVCERKFRKTIFNFYKPRPSGLPPNPILDQFNGLEAASDLNWKVKRDGGTFDFVTGATVTSRAILEAVAEAVKTFSLKEKEFKKEVLP